jgi:RHS repeat-associated protein
LEGAEFETDFGFAGMFWLREIGLNLTLFRAYDPGLGRWLSRDPLNNAELEEGPNLFAYVHNNPVNHTDSLGLSCCEAEEKAFKSAVDLYDKLADLAYDVDRWCFILHREGHPKSGYACDAAVSLILIEMKMLAPDIKAKLRALRKCLSKPCNRHCPKLPYRYR